MRLKRTTQTSLFQPKSVDHPLGQELESISDRLDAHPELLGEVAADLAAGRPSGAVWRDAFRNCGDGCMSF